MGIIFAIGLICMVCVLIFAVVKSGNTYSDYKTLQSLSREDDTSVYYQVMNAGMLRYSKDGAAMSDQSGNVIWNKAYQMNTPIISANGSYAAIGDESASDIYIFNGQGETGHVITDVPIQDLVISDQGVTAAVLADTSGNYINLYDTGGKSLVSIRATLDNTGYPITLALSPDATKLTVSYLVISSGKVQTKVIFYDFSDSSSDYVKGETVLDGLFPKLAFLSSTRVALYGESCFVLYDVAGAATEVRTVEFEDEIKSVFSGDEKIGFVFKNADSAGRYRIEIYDIAGQMNSSSYTDFDYYEIASAPGEIILYNDHEIRIYEYGGHLKFSGDMDYFFTDVMPSWQSDRYWIISDRVLAEIQIE